MFVKNFCEQFEYIFIVDDFIYFVRGGCIFKIFVFVGGLLNIKLFFQMEDGKFVFLEKICGQKKFFKWIIELMKECGDDWGN